MVSDLGDSVGALLSLIDSRFFFPRKPSRVNGWSGRKKGRASGLELCRRHWNPSIGGVSSDSPGLLPTFLTTLVMSSGTLFRFFIFHFAFSRRTELTGATPRLGSLSAVAEFRNFRLSARTAVRFRL